MNMFLSQQFTKAGASLISLYHFVEVSGAPLGSHPCTLLLPPLPAGVCYFDSFVCFFYVTGWGYQRAGWPSPYLFNFPSAPVSIR